MTPEGSAGNSRRPRVSGYATISAIGFESRRDYGAIGSVTNLAARLCGEAAAGQIHVSQRVGGAVEPFARLEPAGPLTLKGLARPVAAFHLLGLKNLASDRY